MDKKTLDFFKTLNTPPVTEEKARKRFLRLHFFDFYEASGLKNSIQTYREYRSLCRGIYGCDLIAARPRKKVDPVETQMELFA